MKKTFTGPSLAEFEAAREIVSRVAQVTPLEESRALSKILGSHVVLKCENLQRTGSYKVRGAYFRLNQLTEEEKSRGVVAASAGNHAQGVALAAHQLGIHSTIFMPIGVALPKLLATREYGADVVLRGDTFTESLAAAIDFSEKSGAVFIPPYDDPDVITGQGTLGLELLEQLDGIDTVIVPVGGGGLIAGLSSAIKQRAAVTGQKIRVIGVQSENVAPYPKSLKAGKPVAIKMQPTIADGISVALPGTLNFEIIKKTVDDFVTVSDDDIARALVVLLERAKLVVEPAGAVGIAAIMAGKIKKSAGTTVAILSGGNIDPKVMEKVLSHGLVASGRYMRIRIPLPDRPGQLARIAEIVAGLNANVVEVLHTRHGTGLQITQVELDVDIETRGHEHAAQVLEALRAEGYDPKVGY